MKQHSTQYIHKILEFFFALIMNACLLIPSKGIAQSTAIQDQSKVNLLSGKDNYSPSFTSTPDQDVFGTGGVFIRNVGQYGDLLERAPQMGKILFAYEGLEMPVLFTSKGLVYLQRKTHSLKESEKEKLEAKGIPESELEKRTTVTERMLTMNWMNANPDPEIIVDEVSAAYFTYGWLQEKADAYKKITYKNLYPGIDLVYTFDAIKKHGFEYSLIVSAGADLNLISMHYGGDLRKIKKEKDGSLIIRSDINGIKQSLPICFYDADGNLSSNGKIQLNAEYKISNDDVRFYFPDGYDAQRNLVIDPFVSSTANLTGGNAGKAKDIDFDYAGNIFVTGGGDGSIYKLAKYDPNGILQWTFNGTLAVPAWSFGTYYGGWVVEKTTGSTYLGQGFAPGAGFRIIRLNAAGIYDNYISTGNPSFQEDWKMLWSCNNGAPRILVAGGGTNSNINLGICTPPSTTISSVNITGIPYSVGTGWAQDISDIIIDPSNNDMYTIYGSLIGTPTLSNKIYKNTAPYSGTSIAWNITSGFTTIQEIANRPYLLGPQIDNSSNVLAVNSSYMFYWDGKNLKAFDKATGAGVGTPLSIAANTALMQGGIIADECNNIFIGSINGTVKVYKFTGSIFDDAADPDITISGFPTSSVYDLLNNDAQKLLYVCGNGFVASVDISAYGCSSTVYSVAATTNCTTLSATAVLSPNPPSGSTVTYILYNGTTQVASNSTGIFTGLLPNVTYTVHAIVNQTCSGTQTLTTFNIVAPNLSITKTDASCGSASGTITATASGGTGALSYSIDGVNFQSSGIFTGLTAGVYTLTVRDGSGCGNSGVVTIVNSNGPSVSLAKTDASCGTANGTITASGSGGTAPYSYSIDNGSFQVSPSFTGLISGNHVITVKDATGCTNSGNILINNVGVTTITATTIGASCGNNNGSITATVSGGLAPYSYSLNGVNFVANNIFTGMASGNYTLTVKDSTGCINSVPVTLTDISGPVISATAVPTSCNSFTGTITVSSSGGTAPVQFSLNNGLTFQTSTVFSGLQGGAYTVLARDANGCTNTISVIVNLSLPQVTDSAATASCNLSDGAIFAIGTGGIQPYQYSLNGSAFQSGNIFSGLSAGAYSLTIKDANGCTNSISPVVVNNASGLQITTSSTISSCTLANGTITASGSGGTAPLQYSINGVTYQSSGIFNGLSAGAYTVTVKDAAGCTSQFRTIVNSIPAPTVTATATTTSCNSNNGTITASAGGGTAPYQFSINGTTFQAGNVFSGLLSGSYTVTVKDVNGCTGTFPIVITNIGGGSGPTVTATSVPAQCGQSNGRIDANSSGGQNPTRHSIDGINYQSSGTFNNIPPGTYTVYARDANGCISTTTVVVGNLAGPQVTATTTPSLCGSGTGTITTTGSNGTPTYRYSIDGGNTFQTGSLFSGLTAGFYTVTIRDAANVCRNSIVVYVANSNGPAISASKTDASCGINNGIINASATGGVAPITFSLNGINFQNSGTFTGLSAGQYAITAKDATGCINISSITLNAAPLPQVSASSTPEACGQGNGSIILIGSSGTLPYQYSIDGTTFQANGNFNGLSAGLYSLTLRDANGCISSTNVTVSGITGPLLSATSSAACSPGSGKIIVTGSGGSAPYQYSINGTVFQTSFIFTNLAIGPYTVTIKDANNCINTTSVNVNPGSSPNVSATTTAASCGSANGSITAFGSGGTGPYQYSINGINFQSATLFAGLGIGTYTLTIRDANGCTNSTTAIISVASGTTLTWTGAVSTDWHDQNNWGGCVVPDCRYNVAIPGGPVNQPVISLQDASCRSITIISCARLTLSANRQLMVCNDYTNNGLFTAGNSSTVLFQDTCLGCSGGVIHNQIVTGVLAGTSKFWHFTVNKPAGTMVTLNQNTDITGNLTTTNATSILNTNNRRIRLGGDFNNAAGGTTYINSFPSGFLEFIGTALQNYSAGGALDLQNVIINNTGAGVNLIGNNMSVSTSGSLSLQLGNIITNALEVTMKNNSPGAIIGGSVNSFIQGYLRRYLDGTASSYDFPVGHILKRYQKANVRFTTNTTIPDLLANFETYPALPNGPVSSDCLGYNYSLFPVLDNGYWNFIPSANNNSGTFDLTLFNTNFTAVPMFTTVVSSALTPPSTASWTLNGICNMGSTPAQTRRDGLNGFSSFGTGVSGSPLPIELLSFSGYASGNKNVLEWVTATEINNEYFTLEHSADGFRFEEIEKIDGAGNSTEEKQYSTVDEFPLPGRTYYRLKQTDFDGKFTYSNTIVILNKVNSEGTQVSIQPGQHLLTVDYNSQSSHRIRISILNTLGEQIIEETKSVNKGPERFQVNLDGFAAGTYLFKLEDENGMPVYTGIFSEL